MITYQNGCDTVKTHDVLYSRPDAIRKMAIMMLVNAAESNIDMVCDMPEAYGSKADIDGAFQGLNEQALAMLEDNIADLRLSLENFLQKTKITAQVRRLNYNKEGKLDGITLDLDVA
jgi:hypothetical protein